MKDVKFVNPATGRTYKRISKTEAKKRFMAGKLFIMAPCNMMLFTGWGGWSLVDSTAGLAEKSELNFNRIVNLFTYYNCNNQLGKYPSFYACAVGSDA